MKITDDEWREFQSIPEEGHSHRAWVDERIRERVESVIGESTVVEEWGMKWPDGEYHGGDGIHAYPHPERKYAEAAIKTHRTMGARIFRRYRTTHFENVTEWEEVE